VRLEIVDVFAEKRYAGNQLAVVRDANGLDDATMQAIAREMNFSETTFVIDEVDGGAKVRIFTPAEELPFAGHPTIGTAWVLGRDRSAYTLRLPIGEVEVCFDGESGVCWMSPPPPSLNDFFDPERAARAIGLASEDLDPELPARFVEVGPEFLFIGLRDLDTLKRAKLDESYHDAILAEGLPAFGVFVFSPEAYSPEADYSARLFFRAGGLREDPATGSANAAFAAYLREHRGPPLEVVVEQGFEIGRPSRLYLEIGDELRVGGRVQPVFEGTLVDDSSD